MGAAIVNFATLRQTAAQVFYGKLAAKTSDAQIDKASTFSKEDQDRLDLLTRLLTGSSTTAADLAALSTWIRKVSGECVALAEALSDAKLENARAAKAAAVEARKLAGLDSTKLFKDEPLPGIGSENWRFLWQAARQFSVSEAFAGKAFPVVSTTEKDVACVLCLQPLSADASSRLKRFEAFVSGAIATAADEAEARVEAMVEAITELGSFAAADWDARLQQITERDKSIDDALTTFKSGVENRRTLLIGLFDGDEETEVSPLPPALASPSDALNVLAEAIAKEADSAKAVLDDAERAKLVNEQAELEDRKILSLNVTTLKKRRDLLLQDGLYGAALSEVVT